MPFARFALALLCVCAIHVLLAEGQIRTFSAPVRITETGSEGVIRSFDATLYYDNNNAGGGTETMLLEVPLNSANISVFQLDIYEDQFLRFSWCEDTCGWEDLFGRALPQLWCPASGGLPSTEDVNGVPAGDLVMHLNGDVVIWCRAADLEPVAAIQQGADVDTRYDFSFPVEQTLSAGIFTPPAFCPAVDPSCFRLDLMIIVDHSGSVVQSWRKQMNFVANLIDEFTVSEKAFQVGVISYGGTSNCDTGSSTTTLISPLSSDKEAIIAAVLASGIDPPSVSTTNECVNATGGFTATVKGVSAGFDQFEALGRVATNRATIVITDGAGNRPGTSFDGGLSVPSDCGGRQWITAPDSCCNSNTNQNNHDDWLCYMYQCRLLEIGSVNYVIGIGGLSIPRLNRVAANSGTDCSGIGGGGGDSGTLQERAILLDSFDALGEVTFDLSAQLLCPSAGQSPCADSCRPGGFCCGGQCVCTDDCSAVGDECQTGACITTSLGTQCAALGDPCSSSDDQTPAIIGGVFGALFAVCCLLAALLAAILLAVLLIRKARSDVEAFENAFATDKDVSENPMFQEKNESIANALYE